MMLVKPAVTDAAAAVSDDGPLTDIDVRPLACRRAHAARAFARRQSAPA